MMISEWLKLRREKREFENLMIIMKIPDFKLVKHTKIRNGHILKVAIPPTSSYSELEKKKEQLEDHFKGIIELEKIRFTNMINMKVITKDLGKYEFSPVKTYANKLFIAKEFDETPFFVNLDVEGNILIGGMSGTGKTFLLATILTNLIATNERHIEIHLSQIMKGEVGQFANCRCVKSVNYNLNEVAARLTKIKKKVDERGKFFNSLGIKNLTHYIQKTGKPMKRIFFVIEEVSFFMPSEADPDDVKELKAICWDAILQIVKAGRSAGVHFMSVTQRSTVANIPSEVKSQMCCITTKQRSGLDSRNIVEVDDAKDLKERECLVWGREGLRLLKLPFIDEDFYDLKEYVPEIIVYDENQEIAKLESCDIIEVESKVEKVFYEDIELETYNRIQEHKDNNNIVLKEEKVETPKPKKRGRPKKGAVIEDVAVTKER